MDGSNLMISIKIKYLEAEEASEGSISVKIENGPAITKTYVLLKLVY